MKQLQNDLRARYVKPALKTFSISVEANVCQGGSPIPEFLNGGILGGGNDDFDFFEF